MKSECISADFLPTGIIGVGVVGGKRIGIDEEAYFEDKNLRPLRKFCGLENMKRFPQKNFL
jgi:hypothetical protein